MPVDESVEWRRHSPGAWTLEMCTSHTRSFECLYRVHDPAEVKEKPAGLLMDGRGGLARGGGNQPLPPACAAYRRQGAAKSSHPEGINGLLTITIY